MWDGPYQNRDVQAIQCTGLLEYSSMEITCEYNKMVIPFKTFEVDHSQAKCLNCPVQSLIFINGNSSQIN